jgi:iron complex transport system substrate-binding protein
LSQPVARRVITLTPSLTEIVWALGAGERVVAVSDYCDYPDEARQRPRIGSFLSPNSERILALQPDLVLLDAVQHQVAGVLEQAGVRVVAVPMQDLAQVRQAMVTVGEALGDRRSAGEALRAALDRELGEVQRQTAGQPPKRAMFVVDRQIGGLRGMVVAGPGSYLDELLTLAGGTNVFGDLGTKYGKVAVEAIEERRPEVILDAVHTEQAQAEQLRRDWLPLKEVPAVRNGQVQVLASREFVTPGPRLGQALRRLAAMLHPVVVRADAGSR